MESIEAVGIAGAIVTGWRWAIKRRKGNCRLRIADLDGRLQIVDLDGRLVIADLDGRLAIENF
jgi:hypothetical protein